MIKINLLREPTKKTATFHSSESRVFVFFLVALISTGLLMAGWCWHLSNELTEYQGELGRLEQESERLKTLQVELQKYEERKAMLESRLGIIEQLKNNQKGPVMLMNSMVASVPEEPQLWLSNTTQKGGSVSIEGNAFNVPAIADFIAQLNRKSPFQNVELDFWEQTEQTLKFRLTCEVENN